MPFDAREMILIRHAPAQSDGRLCGRVDVPARLDDPDGLARLSSLLAEVAHVVTSPALRCRQTAEALFPGRAMAKDPRLWEQDFGIEDGMALADLPDLGPLPLADLAARAPEGGESFAQMVARVRPALEALAAGPGPIAVVAHAGTVRAALATALGVVPPALAFEVDTLSLTRLRCLDGVFSIISVNGRA